eukprot:15450693-Alexandrium_andersonii.AAC.1
MPDLALECHVLGGFLQPPGFLTAARWFPTPCVVFLHGGASGSAVGNVLQRANRDLSALQRLMNRSCEQQSLTFARG